MKLPRTLHIEGSRMPPGQLDSDATPFNKLKGEFLIIEEKLDGTGVSIGFDHNCDPYISHRGSKANGSEFKLLNSWAEHHEDELFDLLECSTFGSRYILFGEWMYYKHTIFYDTLPVYFLESDIYDSKTESFLSTARRQELLKLTPFIKSVPILYSGVIDSLNQITNLVGESLYRSDNWEDKLKTSCMNQSINFETAVKETDCSKLMEGLYIKHESENAILNRYKYVRYDFVQNIINSNSHIRDRSPIKNILADPNSEYY